MLCPTCGGQQTIEALVNRGSKGCAMEAIRCYRCKGTGEVPDVAEEWQRIGEFLRGDRLRRDRSQREEAKRLGLDVTLIGKMEAGVINPASYHSAWLDAGAAEQSRIGALPDRGQIGWEEP